MTTKPKQTNPKKASPKQTSLTDPPVPEEGSPIDETLPVGAELVTQEEETSLPATATSYDYDEEDEYEGEEEDQSIPTIFVVQKTHDELVAAGHLGKLYSPEMDMVFDKLNVAILLKWNSRVMWPEKYKKDNDPLCRSKDGLMPACDIVDAEGNTIDAYGKCCDWDRSTLGKRGVRPQRQCSYANWSGTNDAPIPPACTEIINMILIDMATEIPFSYRVSSTAMTPFKKELTKPMGYRKMSLSAKRRKQGLGKAINCMFSFDFSVDPTDRESDSGSSKLPLFENIVELDDAQIKQNLTWRHGLIPYVEIMKNATFEQDGSGGGGDSSGDDGEDVATDSAFD